MTHAPDHKNLITCSSCYRSLSLAYFGVSTYYRSGRSAHCLKCHAERNSYYNCKRAGWTPKVHTADLIYNVNRHNQAILEESATMDMTILGFGVKDKCLYRIEIFKGQYLNRMIRIYKGESLHWAIELNLNETGIATVLKLLKQDYIRLERSEIDLINVKTLIYDLGD